MPTMTVPSAEGLEISRRRAAMAPTGGVAKPSPLPPNTFVLALPAPLPPRTTSRPPAPRRVAGGDGARPERARSAVPSTARPRSRHAAAAPSEVVRKGAQVRVRTRVGTARSTGQPILLWLLAVVDSAAADGDDGCLRVTYSHDINGKLPRVARVAPSDVRLHDVAPPAVNSSAVTSDRSARPMPQQNMVAPPRPRPTVAGKKLPLLKKFEDEMKSMSNAIIGC
ncbi:unnamed protein product [Urochloa humidicola]